MILRKSIFLNYKHLYNVRLINYIQGQTNKNIREYFYYVDHQGQVCITKEMVVL